MTVKRKSPETTNPNKKHKRISRDEKIEIAISKLEEYEKSVKDTLKMLRDIKRESLRPPPINIPEVTATFSSSDEDNTPKYEMITAPKQLIDSVTSKRVFPDGEKIIHYHDAQAWEDIQQAAMLSPRSPFFGDLRGQTPLPKECIDLTCDTPQAHSPCLPNFVGSPRMCEEGCDCFDDYSGLEGKMKAFYDWRVVPLQALARGWLVRKNKKQAPTPRISYDGKMRAYYGCQAIKMQAVVRGGLVRMRRWRERVKRKSKILLNVTIKIQALIRGALTRKRLKTHNRIAKLIINTPAIKIQALARRFLVRMRVWNVRSTNPEFASAMKSAVRGWLLGEPKKCVKHDLKPVRSGYDHTTYECRNCDYESGCV